MENKQLIFDTPDLGLASYIHCNGVKINDAVMLEMKERGGRKIGSRFAFVFDNEEGKCQQLEIDYGNGGLVKARDYDNSVKFLKMLVKSKKYNSKKDIEKEFEQKS